MNTTYKSLLFGFLLSGIPLCVTSQTIYNNKYYKWEGNEIIQGKFQAKAISNKEILSNYQPLNTSNLSRELSNPSIINRKHWLLKTDISHLPSYTSDNILDNAIYNMSLEESLLAIEPDSTFRTGIYWGGVWTRDISYSIIHSLAQLHPEISKKSLMAKVNANNRIIQDTGTGGAWPCSTDRVVWILAAWEVYLVTGDEDWLNLIYPIIRNTIDDDYQTVFDAKTGLMHGETSYLDWRKQEYPTWMQPADIYQSEALGTNAIHYKAVSILAQICEIEGQSTDATHYHKVAQQISNGINKHLWIENKGYYGIYLYGRYHQRLNQQSETLGEALSVLFGIADFKRAKTIMSNVVNEPFGTPCFYPNLSDQPPYHNNGVWPFVQGFWMKANAYVGNEEGVLHSISSIYRSAALHLTNQENFVVYNGDYGGTEINSARQLWSLAANISIVHNIYFGMQYTVDGLHFAPFIPKKLNGNRRLANFHYRNATLDVTLTGFGNKIKRFLLDGKQSRAIVPYDLKGHHTLLIELTNQQPNPQRITYAENSCIPETPQTYLDGVNLRWNRVKNAVSYRILLNGKETKTLQSDVLFYQITAEGEYQVEAIDDAGNISYTSEPIPYYRHVQTYEVEQYATKNVSSTDGIKEEYTQISKDKNTIITIPIIIETEGDYAFDWLYANGNGPIDTDNKCALRLLKLDGINKGASVFPQRGVDEWNNWGYSNAICIHLSKGNHIITLEFSCNTENMNILENKALLNQLRITKL